MSSTHGGYYIDFKDLGEWLAIAQSSALTKNKVRKDLWSDFTERLHYGQPREDRDRFVRVSSSTFISMQTFCMVDGKGQDTVSNDQLLNFVTTLDQLRKLYAVCADYVQMVAHLEIHDDVEEEAEPSPEALPKTARKEKEAR